MTNRISILVAVLGLLVFTAAVGAAIPLAAANGNLQTGNLQTDFPLLVAFAAFMAVGALLMARRPAHLVGRLFSAVGLLAATLYLAQQYAEYAFFTRPGSLPLATFALWYSNISWLPLIGLALAAVPFYFPTGKPVSPRWRPVGWLIGFVIVASTILSAVVPELSLQDEDLSVANPIGVSFGGAEQGPLVDAWLALASATLVAAIISLVFRFRRSRGEERQQLKWFTFAGVLVVVVGTLREMLPLDVVAGDAIFGALVSFLPASAAIAILRYRLYEIDRIVNRTLVYAALTGLLATVYVGSVVVLGGLLRPVTGSNDLAVAGSTLAVAALFSPLRRRVQVFVDRRFYRRRYDAARTVEVFSERLRDEVDLDTLRSDLAGVVQEALQPASVSVWLRDAEA